MPSPQRRELAAPTRPPGRQLALPLPPFAPLAPGPPPRVPVGPSVRPHRVWAHLPAGAQAQVRQTVRAVLEEIVRHELCDPRG
jgi:hypothetical protein